MYKVNREGNMKKSFKMKNLDCAHCAAKMEEAAKKVAGVNDASISFMLQKITVEAEDEKFEKVMEDIRAVCKSIEPDCMIL